MGGKTIQFYDCAFFAGHSDRGLQSARPILSDLCSRLQRVRVFDIGCGGAWLRKAPDFGPNEILTIDGDDVDRSMVTIRPEEPARPSRWPSPSITMRNSSAPV
jgi:hypothetical protein